MAIEPTRDVECPSDRGGMVHGEAGRVVARAGAAIAHGDRLLLGLPGGATPQPLDELLATPALASKSNGSRVHVFWADKQCVPPGDPRSDFRMARDALLDHVPLPPANAHRIRGADEEAQAAAASLLPDSAAARETHRWVVASLGQQPESWVVTLGRCC